MSEKFCVSMVPVTPELKVMGVGRVKLFVNWSVAEPVNVSPAAF